METPTASDPFPERSERMKCTWELIFIKREELISRAGKPFYTKVPPWNQSACPRILDIPVPHLMLEPGLMISLSPSFFLYLFLSFFSFTLLWERPKQSSKLHLQESLKWKQQFSWSSAWTKPSGAFIPSCVPLPECCIRDTLPGEVTKWNVHIAFHPWFCGCSWVLPVPAHTLRLQMLSVHLGYSASPITDIPNHLLIHSLSHFFFLSKGSQYYLSVLIKFN